MAFKVRFIQGTWFLKVMVLDGMWSLMMELREVLKVSQRLLISMFSLDLSIIAVDSFVHSSLISHQLALLNFNIVLFLNCWYCGLMMESIITASWSEMPGTTLTPLTKELLFVKQRSRMFP